MLFTKGCGFDPHGLRVFAFYFYWPFFSQLLELPCRLPSTKYSGGSGNTGFTDAVYSGISENTYTNM